MDSISNMTVGQVFVWLKHHWIHILVLMIASDNVLITAFTAAGWDTTFLQRVSKFLGSILLQGAKKIAAPVAKVAPILLICAASLFGVGCASYTFNHLHGNANGAFVYNGIPVTGNATIDSYSCLGTCPSLNALDKTTIDSVNVTMNSIK